ncbi:MAG: TadE/TadG family type IV pilus assembly protein [Planctomycetaceae bacterium]
MRRLRTISETSRRGAAVEFAVCLPVMLMIVFGSIEAANAIYLKQIVTQAAYETARVVTTPGNTAADARAFGEHVLAARSVENATITISPEASSTTPSGQLMTITVSAPSDSNFYSPLQYFRGQTIESRVVMVRN